jgi:hypothetical protein
MKTYTITTHQGYSADLQAENEDDLHKKLATGLYGVTPRLGPPIPFSPKNVKEILEVIEE